MGAVDLVAADRVARSRSRAGCSASDAPATASDEVSRGRIFPKFRGDLLECAVVARRMREGLIEPTVVPRNALDVLAQQIVAIAVASRRARRPRTGRHGAARGRARRRRCVTVDELHALVTRTYSYAELSRELLENVLDMLDGRYPSHEFGELRARIVWDRVAGHDPRRARARASSRSPTPARSPTAACTP